MAKADKVRAKTSQKVVRSMQQPVDQRKFHPKIRRLAWRKRKHKQGEQQRQKQVSVSRGTEVERWIRPGSGRVKWAPAIKSRQAKRQEPLSSELKANTEGQ